MAEQIPYTYLIGWKEHQTFYYGVRYAKTCNPEELWKTYFTSSHYVHEFAKSHGSPDVIEIRKTFGTPIDAIKWERKVLLRMKVIYRDDFLNANVAGSFIFTEEILNRMKETKKKNKDNNIGMSNKMWITDGITSKVISKDDLVPSGWNKGRKVSTLSDLSLQSNEKKQLFWITNGKNNKRVSEDTMIPEGWSKGHSVRNENSIKGSQNTILITNSIENKKIRKTDMIPIGWKRGRINIFIGRWGDK